MIDVDNVTCDNGFAYYIQNHTTRTDRSIQGVWRLDEGRENRILDGAGNNDYGQVYGALRAAYNMEKSTDSYVYEDLVNVTDYTIANGDLLEYDVYWTSKDDKIAFDYTTTSGVSLRSTGVDQTPLSANPSTDLSAYALNRWYHRKISITGHAGLTIKYYDIACENDDSATRLAYLDNIVITNGGVLKKVIWRGGTPEHSIHPGRQVSGAVDLLDDYPAPLEMNTAGKYKYGLTLDGVDDYAVVQDSKLKLGINQTVMVWVNVKGNSSDWVRIAGKGNNTLRNYGLWRAANGDLLFQVYGNPIGCNFWTNAGPGSPLNLPTDTGWIQLAATYDGTYGDIYINGSQVYSGMCSTTPWTSDDPFTIGYAGFHSYLNGSVDDVMVYNRTLGPDEIMKAYLRPKQVCVSGQNMSVNDTYYTIYDSKTATFSPSNEEEISSIDDDVNLLVPTMTLKVMIYQPAKPGV
jgi:hypothetical protein